MVEFVNVFERILDIASELLWKNSHTDCQLSKTGVIQYIYIYIHI